MPAWKRAFCPQLERLENRWCPAVDVSVIGRTMFIRGDAGGDTITITDNGIGGISGAIVGPGGTDTAAGTNIQNIYVFGNDGNDIVNYTLTGVLNQRRNMFVYLGNGDDQANLNFNAGLDTSFLYVVVTGWNGDDQITADLGSVNRSTVTFLEYLQRNNDTTTYRFNGLIDTSIVTAFADCGYENDDFNIDLNNVNSSRVSISAWLSAGNDTMDARLLGVFTGNSVVAINTWDGYGNDTVTYQATGANVGTGTVLSLNTYSYQGNDLVNLTYSGIVDGWLSMNVAGGMDSDNFTANITLNAGSTGRFSGRMFGWWAPDILTFNVFNNSGGTLASLFALLDGGWFGGNTCTHTSHVRTFNC